jgi:hypothetical protein
MLICVMLCYLCVMFAIIVTLGERDMRPWVTVCVSFTLRNGFIVMWEHANVSPNAVDPTL